MGFKSTFVAAALAALAVVDSGVQARAVEDRQARPTIYLAGDSTMAKTPSPHNGWGEYLSKYVTIPVVNRAISGRSARSYTNEGRFAEIEKLLVAGDIVVIEFGHNDGGSPNNANDNLRSACPGTGSEVCRSGKTGEAVYTFNYYLEKAARSLIAKGAQVVISSQTPNNQWEGGSYNGAASRFVGYAPQAARNAGQGASFVDHFQSVSNMFKKLGRDKTQALYPKDHTHTSPEGADLIAQAFVQAVSRDMNGTTPLKQYLKAGLPTVW